MNNEIVERHHEAHFDGITAESKVAAISIKQLIYIALVITKKSQYAALDRIDFHAVILHGVQYLSVGQQPVSVGLTPRVKVNHYRLRYMPKSHAGFRKPEIWLPIV